MSWKPFWGLLGGSWVSWQSIGISWESFGVSWGPLGRPLRLLEGVLVVLGVSWGRFWGVGAPKRYQHDAKMDIQSSTALKKARFPFLCVHRFGQRPVFGAICSTFAGSAQIKGPSLQRGYQRPPGILFGAFWVALGVLWGVSWRPSGASWQSLGAFSRFLGGFGVPWRVYGQCCRASSGSAGVA